MTEEEKKQLELEFVTEWLKTNHTKPTFAGAIEWASNRMVAEACKRLCSECPFELACGGKNPCHDIEIIRHAMGQDQG